MRTIVISDVQGNGEALDAALSLAGDTGFDELVLLGDLLTYGCEPVRVLARVEQLVRRGGVCLVEGNHDRLYIDVPRGETGYYERLPGWIRESVDWTLLRLAEAKLAVDALPWCAEAVVEGVHFAHANPFGPRDWTYLNADAELERAAVVLRGRGFHAGVYGHTHRAEVVRFTDEGRLIERLPGPGRSSDGLRIVNAGSVGQPRDARHLPVILRIDHVAAGARFEILPVAYDVSRAVQHVVEAGMSADTTHRLVDYLSTRGQT